MEPGKPDVLFLVEIVARREVAHRALLDLAGVKTHFETIQEYSDYYDTAIIVVKPVIVGAAEAHPDTMNFPTLYPELQPTQEMPVPSKEAPHDAFLR